MGIRQTSWSRVISPQKKMQIIKGYLELKNDGYCVKELGEYARRWGVRTGTISRWIREMREEEEGC